MSDWANQLVETRRRESLSKREPHRAYAQTCVPILRSLHEAILSFLRRLPREIRWAVSDGQLGVDKDSSLFSDYELIYSAGFPGADSPLLHIQGRPASTWLKSSETFGALLAELEGSLDCVSQCKITPVFKIIARTGHYVHWRSYSCGSAPWVKGTGFYFPPETSAKRTVLSFFEQLTHRDHFRHEETNTQYAFSALSEAEIETMVRSVIEARPFRPAKLAFGTVLTTNKTYLGK